MFYSSIDKMHFLYSIWLDESEFDVLLPLLFFP